MEIEKVIEKLLNSGSILNLLENGIIEKFEVVKNPHSDVILVIKMYLNSTEDELVGSGESSPKLSNTELKDKLWKNYQLDPAWWQASIIPNKILKPLVGKDYFRKIFLYVLDKNGHYLFSEN
jgi:hypothetical protein